MAAIAVQGTGLRHVRKTINFDGSANNGNLDDEVPIFTTTGRVFVAFWTAYISDAFATSDSATYFRVGAAGGSGDALVDIDLGSILGTGYLTSEAIKPGLSLVSANQNPSNHPFQLAANLVCKPYTDTTAADITDGTLVVNAWYHPETDDGALAGDDIDTELVAAVWAYATRILTALDEDSTTLDLDATIRAALGMSSANLDTQIGDLPTNAELATSQAAADDATLAAIAALNNPSAATIADAVWDEAVAGHVSAGTFGATDAAILADTNELQADDYPTSIAAIKSDTAAILIDTATIDTAGEIAAAVWSADATTYQTQGTFGQAIGDPAADTNSIFKAVVTDATGATVGVDVVAVKAETAAIVADTNELQTDDYPTSIAAVKSDTAAVLTDTADMQPKLGTPAVSVSADIAAIKAETAAIVNDTDVIDDGTSGLVKIAQDVAAILVDTGTTLDTLVKDIPTSAELATALGTADDAVLAAIAGLFTTALTESYNTDGAAPTVAQALFAILQVLTEMTVSGTTATVKKLDGSTTAFTLTLNDAATPTGITRAT